MVRDGGLELALSVPVFEEYRQVLLRPQTLRETGRLRAEMETVLDFLAQWSPDADPLPLATEPDSGRR